MRIKTQREDGTPETITLVPPLEVHYGKSLNHIRDASEMEHFFTEEGYYDGWGTSNRDVIAREAGKFPKEDEATGGPKGEWEGETT